MREIHQDTKQYYIATKDVVADGAIIKVKAIDSYGNESRKQQKASWLSI